MKIQCPLKLEGEDLGQLLAYLSVRDNYTDEVRFKRPESEVIRKLEAELREGYRVLNLSSPDADELVRERIMQYREERRVYELLRIYGENKEEISLALREHFRECKDCATYYEEHLHSELIEINIDTGEGSPNYSIPHLDKSFIGLYS